MQYFLDTSCTITSDEMGDHAVMVRVSDGELADSVVWNVFATAISFELPAASRVSLRVYNIAGREVATLVEGWRGAGRYEVTLDGTSLPSGVYLLRVEVSGLRQPRLQEGGEPQLQEVRKLILLK
jgi:hypothetical protein